MTFDHSRARPLPVRLAAVLASSLIAVGFAIILAAGPAWAQAPATDPIVASVNGEPITELDLKLAEEDLGSQIPPNAPAAQKREYLIGYVADLKLGAKAAEAAKIAETPEFLRRATYLRQKAMLEILMAREADRVATAETAQKFYDETVKNLKPEPEVRARHILVETEDAAQKAYARVTSGKEDFAKVATELSKDPGSGKDGGDLGWFAQDRMVKEFGDVAFAQKPGEVSQPVKSQFGWHVIKTEERRDKAPPTFETVRDELITYLGRKAQQDMVLSLRKDAKIERPAPAVEPKKP